MCQVAGIHGTEYEYTYYVDLMVPGEMTFKTLEVTEGELEDVESLSGWMSSHRETSAYIMVITKIEYPQSSKSKELKELQEAIAPLRSDGKLEDVCSLASLFHLFWLNADIH